MRVYIHFTTYFAGEYFLSRLQCWGSCISFNSKAFKITVVLFRIIIKQKNVQQNQSTCVIYFFKVFVRELERVGFSTKMVL